MAQRILGEVIGLMLVEIPETETKLREKLISARNSACYAAPEFMVAYWRMTQEVLVTCVGIPDPKVAWQMRVAKIFSGP